MTDRKPPRLESDERATLLAALQYVRESFVRKVEGLDDDAAGRRFVASDTTLLWLTRHLAHAELLWVAARFAGEPMVGDPVPAPTDDRIVDAIADYRAGWARVDAIVAASPDLGAPCRAIDVEPNVSLRWVLVHLIEETARHAGHADILRELVDGETGR